MDNASPAKQTVDDKKWQEKILKVGEYGVAFLQGEWVPNSTCNSLQLVKYDSYEAGQEI